MSKYRAMPLSLAGTMLLALATGCGEESSPADPGDPGATPAEVNTYLTELPTWSQFTADVNGPDQPPTPTGSAEPRREHSRCSQVPGRPEGPTSRRSGPRR